MGTLLPRRGEREAEPEEPRVLGLEEEAADEAFAALSSETARRVLAMVYEEPATPVDIRDEIGTSLQNVHYHVEKLEGADLIEPVGTDYSSKGNEMNVYAPTSEALVLVAGEDEDHSLLKRAIGRVLAGVGVLAGGALTFGYAVQRFARDTGQAGMMSIESTEPAPTPLLTQPAVAFFLGGAFALVVAGAWWYVRR